MKQAIVVCGMAFGDEGKGSLTDSLCRSFDSKLVVRYGGGPQCAHNVTTPEGVHHTFSQFGSGTMAGARTHLSRFMLVEPIALRIEAEVLAGKLGDSTWALRELTVDPECVLITPWHWMANQIREKLRSHKHGTTGVGVGEARLDQLDGFTFQVKDVDGLNPISQLRGFKERKIAEMVSLGAKLEDLIWMESVSCTDLLRDYREIFHQVGIISTYKRLLLEPGTVILEGHQGVLLDERFGFAPYHSWTDCTFGNADTLLDEAECEDRLRVGVFRTYFTRHGPGPFPTEVHPHALPMEHHNGSHPFMGKFRLGHFDLVLARYAVSVSRPDVLAFTHVDRHLQGPLCISYDHPTGARDRINPEPVMEPVTALLEQADPIYVQSLDITGDVSRELDIPVGVLSHGSQPTNKEFISNIIKGVAK